MTWHQRARHVFMKHSPLSLVPMTSRFQSRYRSQRKHWGGRETWRWSDVTQLVVPVIRLSAGLRWSRARGTREVGAGGWMDWICSRGQHRGESRYVWQGMRALVLPWPHGRGRHADAAKERPASRHHANWQRFLGDSILLPLLGTAVLEPDLRGEKSWQRWVSKSDLSRGSRFGWLVWAFSPCW